MTDHSLYLDKDGNVDEFVKNWYDPLDPRKWPYFVIEMPLTEEGLGPADIPEAHSLTVEVWDRVCTSHGTFGTISQALTEALRLNAELFNE